MLGTVSGWAWDGLDPIVMDPEVVNLPGPGLGA